MKVKKDCGGSAVIAKFKAAKCGAKVNKHEQGGSLNGVPFYQDGGKNKKSINDYYLTDYSEPNIQQKAKLNGKELIIKVNKGQQKGEDPITIQGNNYYLKGDSTLVKDNSIPYSFQQLRNAGINKKYNGGNLNRIPFYQAGTTKGGINITITTPEEIERANEQNKANAKGLFNGIISGQVSPTIPNIGRMISSAYNGWVEPVINPKTDPFLITGEGPVGGKARNVQEALQMVKAMKAAKAAKAARNAEKAKQVAQARSIAAQKGAATRAARGTARGGSPGLKKLEQVPDIPNYQEIYDSYNMTRASRLNMDNVLSKLPDDEREMVLKVIASNPDHYLNVLGNITPSKAGSMISTIRRRLPIEYTSLRVKSLDQTRPHMGTGAFQKFDDATRKTAGFKRTTGSY